VLREFETSAPLSLPDEVVPLIQRRLGSLAELIYGRDGYRLKATAHVGYIPVNDDIQLTVIPKIDRFEDFFYLLECAHLTPKYWAGTFVFSSMADSVRENPPEFLVRVLVTKLQTLRRDGFLRQARLMHENRSSIRGKINISQTTRMLASRGLLQRLYCTYFDLTSNTIENRFIKYTLWRLLRTPGIPSDIRRYLRELWRSFSAIPLSPNERCFEKIETVVRRRHLPATRSYYIDILSLCLLIVGSLTAVVRIGDDIRVSAFTIKMEDLFERYTRYVIESSLQPRYAVVDGNMSRIRLFDNSARPEVPP
jgi:5-methylcytosine-specific restriction endonuclease McrBC regulatory subunit McrC